MTTMYRRAIRKPLASKPAINPLSLIPSVENTGKNSGFFPIPKQDSCQHPDHNFPNMIHIPPGMGYRHICPGCGKEHIAYGSNITM